MISSIIINSGTILNSGTITAGQILTVNTLGAANSWVVNGGQANVFGTAGNTTVQQGGTLTVPSGGAAAGTDINSGGQEVVTTGGVDDSSTVNSGGTFVATGFGATSIGLSVNGGGIGYINVNANAINPFDAGVMVISSGALVSGLEVTRSGVAVIEPGATVIATSGGGSIVSTGVAVLGPGGNSAIFASNATNVAVGNGATEFVLSGGTTTGGSVTSGASQQIFGGGSASALALSGGFQVVNSGASANGTILQPGAAQYVFSGGSAVATAVNGGIAFVNAGGTAAAFQVNSGGNLAVDGLASGATVNSGASEFVYLDGTAVATQLNGGAFAYVYGETNNTDIKSGAYEIVEAGLPTVDTFVTNGNGTSTVSGPGGVATGETVESGGVLLVYGTNDAGASSGMTSNGTIASGGIEVLFSGAVDSGTTVQSGGVFVPLQGSSTSNLHVASDGTIVSTGVVLINTPATVSLPGNLVSGRTLSSGMSAYILSSGTASDTTIGNGGYTELDAGGTAANTLIQGGGVLNVASGGTASGAIEFAGSGGTLDMAVSALPNAVVRGFSPGDVIDFTTIANGSAKLLLNNVLEISNGVTTATLQLDPSQSLADFTVLAQAAGSGTSVTLVSPTATPPPSTPTSNTQTPDIPLYLLPDGTSGYKIGIQVSLDGGATYRMYEFDTGGTGFYASYNPNAWSSYTVNGQPTRIVYASGYTYNAQVVSTNVTLQTLDGGTLSVPNANVGLIDWGEQVGGITPQQWNQDLTGIPSTPPLETNFYGDFGMSLASGSGLSDVLSQISGGLSNGFIINLGTYPNGSNGQIGYVQIGLTAADIASFETNGQVVSMQGQSTLDVHANSGQPTYSEVLAAGTFGLSNPNLPNYSEPSGFVFDTGAPTMEVHSGTVINSGTVLQYLNDAATTTVDVSAPGAAGTSFDGWSLSFPAGTITGQNRVAVSSGDVIGVPTGYVNTGLIPFFRYSIMYDLADGLMGFLATPAPCFAAGTRIMTLSGEVAVDALRVGDEVITVQGEIRSIVWVGHRWVDCMRHPSPDEVWPVRVRAHSFGEGLPQRDLFLSPDHAVFVEGVLIPVKYLVNGITVAQTRRANVTYYHIELARHDIVLAELLPVESYLETGSRAAFANGGTIAHLHPRFGGAVPHWEAFGYAPLVVTGPAVERVRRRLHRCARARTGPARTPKLFVG
jgi:autotransporter passenger strand-loop-strand repeat protein